MKIVSAVEVYNNIDNYTIIDIREPYEYEVANIQCLNIPMAEFCKKIDELPSNKTIVLMCHSGNRASALCNLLHTEFNRKDFVVLEGGIKSWKEHIDSTLNID
ncbi:MAG TPA: rhodanese-like domain-containing protein [Taishania sp.]|nr:rhodanese-like domain-containing protein [Taishania sp.]